LDNIRRELKLFEDVAKQYGWLKELGTAIPNVHTQAYIDLFAGAAQPSSKLFRGIVALWATEKCYLLAWSHAKRHLESQKAKSGVMQDVFVPNWSSNEFMEFVNVLEKLVDEMALMITEEDLLVAEGQWRQVVSAEEAFWP
jgi:thiaminase